MAATAQVAARLPATGISDGLRDGGAVAPVVNPWLVAVSVMLATFMEVLDTAIASVALPYIAGSLAVSNSEATWVLTSYLIANAVILPASNWFGLKFGRKRFLMACVVLFTVASFFCGAAPTLGLLLVARVLQGAGGGALQPLSQAILLESFPPAKRGAAMAMFGFGVVVAPVLGPTLGGWLTDTYSWRYAFYINIPVGALAIFMISRYVRDPDYVRDAKPGAFDNLGFALLCLWTGSLQIILDKGQEDDWFGAVWIRWAVMILGVSLFWFVWHCWKARKPLVDLRVLRDRNFAVGALLIFLLGFAIYITITILPLFYQEVLGYTALTAGIVVFPRGVGSMIGLPVVGVISHKVDNRYLIFGGFILFGVCTLWFSFVNLGISPLTMLAPIILAGFALSFLFVPIASLSVSTLSNERIGNATCVFNLLRNVGGSTGIALAQTYLVRRTSFHEARLAAHVGGSSQWLQQQVAAMGGYLGGRLGPAAGRPAALAAIYRRMEQQALLLSFIDVLRWTAWMIFASAAAARLFHKVTHHEDGSVKIHSGH